MLDDDQGGSSGAEQESTEEGDSGRPEYLDEPAGGYDVSANEDPGPEESRAESTDD